LLTFEDWTEITESVSIVDGKLQFDYANNKSGQSTKLGKSVGKSKFLPRVSKSQTTEGYTVFSVYQMRKGSSKIVKSLKKKTAIQMTREDYDHFITRTAIFIAGRILKKTDVVVTPSSTSFILDDILDKLVSINPKIKYIRETFHKNDANKIKIDYSKFEVSDKVKHMLEGILAKAKIEGFLEVKKIPKQFRKLVTNILIPDNSRLLPKYIDGKNVVVLDDVLSTGGSFVEMARYVENLSPKSVSGVSLFKT